MAIEIDDKTMVKMSHSAALRALAASQRALTKAMGELTEARSEVEKLRAENHALRLELTRWTHPDPHDVWR